jgi:hypothetical protein
MKKMKKREKKTREYRRKNTIMHKYGIAERE